MRTRTCITTTKASSRTKERYASSSSETTTTTSSRAAGFATADDKPIYFIGRLDIGGAPRSKTLTGYAFKSRDTLFEDPGVTSAEIT